jgi:TPR repeat protein
LTLAAEQGDEVALGTLIAIWFRSTPEPDVLDTAWELAWPKARLGNATAQILCARMKSECGDFVEALQWYTLAAAQGEVSAQWILAASFHPKNNFSVKPSIFKCFYWTKQAALKKYPSALAYLPVLANRIAELIHKVDFSKS